MAEAMELDLSLNQPEKQRIENPVPTPIESIDIKKDSDFPSEFTIEKYYDNDSLGSDVLTKIPSTMGKAPLSTLDTSSCRPCIS